VSATGTYKEVFYKYQDTADNWHLRYQTSRFYFYSEISNVIRSNYSNDQILSQDDHWYLIATTVDRDTTFSGIVVNYVDDTAIPNMITTYWFDQDASHTNTGKWTIGHSAQDGHIGITGIYVFDGQNGAESSFPSDSVDLIQEIYDTMWPLYSGLG
jgi:hypothetical protein